MSSITSSAALDVDICRATSLVLVKAVEGDILRSDVANIDAAEVKTRSASEAKRSRDSRHTSAAVHFTWSVAVNVAPPRSRFGASTPCISSSNFLSEE